MNISDNVTVTGNVYGGWVLYTGTAEYNTVTLSGSPIFGATTTIGGGSTSNGANAYTGNTLNVRNYSGNKVSSVQSFQNYNFELPTPQTGFLVTDTLDLGTADGGANVKVGIKGGSALRSGDEIALIKATGTVDGTLAKETIQAKQGATLLYTLVLAKESNKGLYATVDGDPETNPQTKALSEGTLGSVAMVNQGADLAAGQGMESAVRSARAGLAGGYGMAGFGAISGGQSRYNTGSHVDMSSFSLMTGLSKGLELIPGYLTLGAFFEYGSGSYSTYNSFSNAASVSGNGSTYYLGGGILGRMDFLNTGPGHFYAEASGRIGSVHNDYSSDDLRDAAGRKAEYDTDSTYYGLHAGAGYVWNFTEKASLDLYGKYFWTHQDGNSVTLPTGDPVTFDAVDSSRLRGGARFAYAINEHVSPYIGAAYEHELNGKAKATTYGKDIKAPDLTGATGIGELGLSFKPSAIPLTIDLGVQGYVGKREGVSGSLQAKFEF